MKKLFYGLFIIVTSFLIINNVKAANANISVTSSSSRVIVGNTVTITVKIISSDPLGSWQFDIVPSSNLGFVSSSFGGLYIKDVVGSPNEYSKTYTFKFKAKSSGTANVSVKNSSVISYNESKINATNGSVSFKTLTQAELEASYSKNNNLSSLTVEGYPIDFSKDKLNYNLEVENDIESVDIKATKEDSTASIRGTGQINLSEGVNNVNIIVTAQNGSTKTYNIIITRKELNPINVTVNGLNYTIIRKESDLPKANMYYLNSTVIINGEEVPSYYNELTNTNLVALKDSNGAIQFFIYDQGNYKQYDELHFNQLIICPLDEEVKTPSEYHKKTTLIDEKEVVAYISDKYNFPLIYGLNLATGEKHLYKYDSSENTIQRYEEVDKTLENLYFDIIKYGALFIGTSFFILIALLTKKRKKKGFSKKQQEELLKTMKIDITQIKNEKKAEQKEKKRLKEIEQDRILTEKALKIKEQKELKLNKKKERRLKKNKKDNDGMAPL